MVYFTEAMLKRHGMGFEGMRVSVSSLPATSPSTLSKKRWNFVCVRSLRQTPAALLIDESGFKRNWHVLSK
ncbi:hypothetical protein ACLB1R_07810 [Escherichia coli]